MTTLDAKAETLIARLRDWCVDSDPMHRTYAVQQLCNESADALEALPPQPVEVTEEMAAQAIYAALPNFGMEWRPNTAGGLSQVRVDDAWEDAPDRHEDCRRQARAVLALRRPSGDGIQPPSKG